MTLIAVVVVVLSCGAGDDAVTTHSASYSQRLLQAVGRDEASDREVYAELPHVTLWYVGEVVGNRKRPTSLSVILEDDHLIIEMDEGQECPWHDSGRLSSVDVVYDSNGDRLLSELTSGNRLCVGFDEEGRLVEIFQIQPE